ncbi:MAG: aldX [Frankiales bacterium]|nr:aldX [Frankiales bacterium]
MSTDSQDHISRVFAAQRANRTALKRQTAEQRAGRLARLRDEITRRADEIDEALHRDMRRARRGLRNPEIQSVLSELETAIAGLDDWMQREHVEPSPVFAGNETYVQYEPRGVVLLLGPWNFPFALVLGPLVAIVAAGNAAVVKPNEMQPGVSRIVAEILGAVFAQDEVAVVEGGVEVAERLQELPFDHVFFTGSPAVGKRVMAAAARNLTSVTLELGGKCPAILDAEYDLADAAAKIVAARFSNAGQLCLSVDHVWVPKNRQAELLEALCREVDAAFYNDGELRRDRLPRIVDERNFARVNGYLTEAVEVGATVARGGASDPTDLTIEPTIVVDPPLSARIMQEEIFGPLLPVLGYDSLDEPIGHIDETGKPLAMYVFSRTDSFVSEVLDRTSSGGVTVNNVLLHYAEGRLPFGGVNSSGMGRYKGVHGFRELSNPRSVFVQADRVD